jgi:hypothetical protein
VNNYRKDLKKRKNYTKVQYFCTEHHKKIAENAIGSKLADDEPPPGTATPAPAGDSATWESRSVR